MADHHDILDSALDLLRSRQWAGPATNPTLEKRFMTSMHPAQRPRLKLVLGVAGALAACGAVAAATRPTWLGFQSQRAAANTTPAPSAAPAPAQAQPMRTAAAAAPALNHKFNHTHAAPAVAPAPAPRPIAAAQPAQPESEEPVFTMVDEEQESPFAGMSRSDFEDHILDVMSTPMYPKLLAEMLSTDQGRAHLDMVANVLFDAAIAGDFGAQDALTRLLDDIDTTNARAAKEAAAIASGATVTFTIADKIKLAQGRSVVELLMVTPEVQMKMEAERRLVVGKILSDVPVVNLRFQGVQLSPLIEISQPNDLINQAPEEMFEFELEPDEQP